MYFVATIYFALIHDIKTEAIENSKSFTSYPITILAGDEQGNIKGLSSGLPEKTAVVYHHYSQKIGGLARYRTKDGPDVFFVSCKDSSRGYSIARVNKCSFNSDNSELICDEFYQVNFLVTSMAVVGDGLFVGHDNGVVSYCEVNSTDGCKGLKKFGENQINGIAYDMYNDHIYLSHGVQLYRCPSDSNKFNLCEVVFDHDYEESDRQGLLAVHVAYEAVWVGTKDGFLLKCSLVDTNGDFDCDQYYSVGSMVVYDIGSIDDGFVYASFVSVTSACCSAIQMFLKNAEVISNYPKIHVLSSFLVNIDAMYLSTCWRFMVSK